jgi:hypothetical protein
MERLFFFKDKKSRLFSSILLAIPITNFIHRIVLLRGGRFYFFAALTDISIIFVSIYLIYNDYFEYIDRKIKSDGHFYENKFGHNIFFLIRSCFFINIGVMHLLRLFNGGLLCR